MTDTPDPIATWLRLNPDPVADPLSGMAEAGLLAPCPDYAAIARTKSAIVARTGLLGLASVWGGRQLVYRHFLAHGTEAQRAAWAGKALSVAISEPEVGAHPKLLTTRADRVAAGWRITGRKAWVSNGPSADAIIVFAITQENLGRKRYSAFIVPRTTPGLALQAMPGFHALRPSRHCLVTLDCQVPADALLGEPGTAYDRMALPFRDVEDAVGTFAVLGALRHAARIRDADAAELGAVVALTSVYEAGADAVVAALDAGRFQTGDATLVGLRVLALDIAARLRALVGETETLTDLAAVLAIAKGPRLMRQTRLGEAAMRTP
ncbi:MAG TPA: acyl-CoA dehydrogenase family protein [Rhodopila sp.]|uniref:acyl-CoA dehydrogenase family protein n=1 Tax=Rhodopila sp. TaxID=2480087 RepID=UPI002C0A2EC8|nr:acyl-CoA dehydrogenase family protein [Rhodopila sp.]HVY17304.1 acyl-CoA dehydrogenase family protein [Rhodopila sp.]